jgi:hypothetical protein
MTIGELRKAIEGKPDEMEIQVLPKYELAFIEPKPEEVKA